MKRILKIFAIFIAFMVLVIIVTPFFFKSKIKEAIINEANKNLNAKLNFEDVSLSLFSSFPNFDLNLEKFSIVGVDTFKTDTLIYVEDLSVELDLLSVFKGDEYKINSINIDKPLLNLLVLNNGKVNWDITKPSPVDTTTEETSFSLNLDEFIINQANIIYDDKESVLFSELHNFDLNLSGDMTASVTNLDINAKISEFTFAMDGMNFLDKVNMDFDAEISANLDSFSFQFKENTLKMNELTLGFDGKVEMPGNDISTDLTFKLKETSFKNLLSMIPAFYTNDFKSIQTNGNFGLSGFVKGIFNDSLMPAFRLNLDVNKGSLKYPEMPASVEDVRILAVVNSPDSDLNEMTVDISAFHIKILQNIIDMKVFLSNLLQDPNIMANLIGKIDLTGISKVYPLETEMKISGLFDADISFNGAMSMLEKEQYDKFNAKGFLKIANFKYVDKDYPGGIEIPEANVSFNPKSIDLTSFTAKYMSTVMHAKGKLENYFAYIFNNQTLKGRLDLNSEKIVVNEFLTDNSSASTKDTVVSSESTPIDLPANIDFTLTCSIKNIVYDKMDIKDFMGDVQLVDKSLLIKTAKLSMLGGGIGLVGQFSTKNLNNPYVDFKFSLNNIDIPSVYKTFNSIEKIASIAKYVKGGFSGNLRFAALLDKEMSPVMNTIQSSGMLKMTAIEITDAKMFSMLAAALKYDDLSKLKTNAFDLSYEIINGNLFLKPTKLNINSIPTQISGNTNLDQTINYLIDMKIPRAKLGVAANQIIGGMEKQLATNGVTINKSENVDITAIVGGTVTKPSVKLSMKNQTDDIKKQLEDKAKLEAEKAKQLALKEAEKAKALAIQEAEKKKAEAEAKLKAELEKKKKEEEAKLKKKLEEEARKKLKNIKF